MAIVTANSLKPRAIKEKSDPGARMRATAYTGFAVGVVAFVFSFIPYGVVLGLPAGLVMGLKFGGATYLRYLVLRFLLASTGATPWRLIPFLEEAARLDFLRRTGGVGYQFRHSLLREYFADFSETATTRRHTLIHRDADNHSDKHSA